MSTSEELRKKSREFREQADAETTPKLKELLVRHALALRQLAEKLEQNKAA